MDTAELAGSMAHVLATYADFLINRKSTPEEAFEYTKHHIMNLIGVSEKSAANIIRVCVGLYLDEKKYCEGALNELISEMNQ